MRDAHPSTAPLPLPFRRLPRRSLRKEILDEPRGVGPGELERSLRHISEVNRWLGGDGPLLTRLRGLAAERPTAPLTVLDVGVGDGALPRRLAGRLGREGIRMEWSGLDPDGRMLARALASAHDRRRAPAGEAGGLLVRGDGRRLPFRTGAFDVVISTLTLHHLDDEDARQFLAEAARVARLAVLVSDLERHPLPYLGARLLAATRWRRDRITRFDGPLSVLRAFTREELAELSRRAPSPFAHVDVRRRFFFRLVLEGRPRASRRGESAPGAPPPPEGGGDRP